MINKLKMRETVAEILRVQPCPQCVHLAALGGGGALGLQRILHGSLC